MIYDYSEQLESVIADLIERSHNGEDVTERLEELKTVKAELKEQYCEELCKMLQDTKLLMDATANEIKRLQDKKARLNEKVDYIKAQLGVEYELAGQKKLTAGAFTISTLKSTSCVIYEDVFNDERFQEIIEVKKIDKAAVKEALKNGETIEGAVLEEHQNIQVK